MLRLALLIFAVLAGSGCKEEVPVRLNPGAQRIQQVASRQWIVAHGGQATWNGMFDPETGTITYANDLWPWQMALVGQHEFTHALLAAPREDPRTVLRLYHSSAYPVCEADAYPVVIPEPRYVGPAQDH